MVLQEQLEAPAERSRAERISRYVVLSACAATVLLALIALLGWLTHHLSLTGYGAGYVPMAPSSAILFLLSGVFLPFSSDRRRLWVRSVAFTAIGLVAAIELVGPGTVIPSTVNALLVPRPDTLGPVENAKMSPLTSIVFLIVAMSRIVFPTRKGTGSVPAILGLAPAAAGFTVFLGYLYGHPLFHSDYLITVALSTAISFFLLGVALILEPGIASFPTRLVIGETTRARLFRVLLPLAPLTVILDALLVDALPLANPAIRASVFGILMVVMVTTAILSATHSVGGSIDRAMGALTAQEGELRAIFNGTMDAMLIAETEARSSMRIQQPATFSGLPSRVSAARLSPRSPSWASNPSRCGHDFCAWGVSPGRTASPSRTTPCSRSSTR